MSPESQIANPALELGILISGLFFVFLALMSLSVALIRRRSGVRILIWIGLWSGMFGLNDLVNSGLVAAALPNALRVAAPTVTALTGYLILPMGTLSFFELSRGKLRRGLQVLIAIDLLVAAAGLYIFFTSGRINALLPYNNLLAACTTATLVTVLAVPELSRRYLAISGHRVLTIGNILFALQALYANLANVLNWNSPRLFSSAGFAILLLSFAYTAMVMIRANEGRLLSIEKELEIARQLQFSILPARPPELIGLRIAAAYEPMTAVAGDFYQFLPIDEYRMGFLVADVSGHGVPAALIASMIKVATQAVNGCASDPAEVLKRLGASLKDNLRGQFVTASYLWIDTAAGSARYSAAGHPPLLRWRQADGTLTRIQSNGLLFGVTQKSEYPVCEFPVIPGDRFLLYTDGVTEPENEAGEQFGDRQMEQVIRSSQSGTVWDLSKRLLEGIREWQPSSMAQQDDITVIVVDVREV